jgi:hypothetical protein
VSEVQSARSERRVRVHTADGLPLVGFIEREDQDENVGLVYVVRFPSGHEARLTPKEVEIYGG